MRDLILALAIAAAAGAQQKSISGAVTGFKVSSLEIGLLPDRGTATYFKVSADTEVLQVEPGERDLSRAIKVRVTDLSINDRVLVTFVAGMPEARRIVLISATAITKHNQAERLDWQNRGASGTVAAIAGEKITLRNASAEGPSEITVVVTPETRIRRYAPDSVKFADARASTLAEIPIGDQLRTRGKKSADGATLIAEDIVCGTFRTAIGEITAIDRSSRKITIDDLVSKKPLTIRIAADTQIKQMPDFRGLYKDGKGTSDPADSPESAPIGHVLSASKKLDVQKLIDMLPLTTFDALKAGGAVMVSTTVGSSSGEVTATRIISNVNFVIENARAEAEQRGMSTVDVIAGMHGGALGGAGGLNLPAIVP